ncbi:MAG: PEP-CTERM sorting domain-containing protein [Phycisphaerales bacterium]|nr:PEP-CTERM sorting domain-containing protein [Phycisphaerales bacterium]
MHTILTLLAQLPAKAITSETPRIVPEPSSILTLLLGGAFCVLVLFFAFKTPKRNYVEK